MRCAKSGAQCRTMTPSKAYARHLFPMDLPETVEAIKSRTKQQGLSAQDLEPWDRAEPKPAA
jgi:antitoxin component HigA of HigAB toxin-antitoxin module